MLWRMSVGNIQARDLFCHKQKVVVSWIFISSQTPTKHTARVSFSEISLVLIPAVLMFELHCVLTTWDLFCNELTFCSASSSLSSWYFSDGQEMIFMKSEELYSRQRDSPLDFILRLFGTTHTFTVRRRLSLYTRTAFFRIAVYIGNV